MIGADGEQVGIVDLSQALEQARQADLDLVEIAPAAKPPVVKIINWGKYQYQKMKEQQKSRRKAKTAELKQMRFGFKIGQHDQEIKLRKVNDFLERGDRVKLTITFKGREMAHRNLGFEMMDKLLEQIDNEIQVEQKPQLAGRNLTVVIRRK